MADIYTSATQLAVLSAARAVKWTNNPDPTDEPSDGSGVPLEGAVRTLIEVTLREETHRRTVRLGIASVDLLATYSVTIDGTTVTYDAAAGTAADLQEVVDGIAAAINANGTINQIVTATAVDEEDTTTSPRSKVLIRGLTGQAYAVNFTEAGPGAPTLSAVADYESAELRLWWYAGARAGSTPSGRWTAPSGPVPVSRFGFLERYDTPGIDRCHAQLINRAGHPADGAMVTYADPLVYVGPALSEED